MSLEEQNIDAKKALFTHPETKEEIKIPETIFIHEDNRCIKLTFIRPKLGGTRAGGWYQDENNNQFMVKIGGTNQYMEKLLNDLARISVGNDFVAEKTLVSHCDFEGQSQLCFVTSMIPQYRDINSIKGENTKDTIAQRKKHALKFHRVFVFNSLVAFDDTNGGNIGLGEYDNAKIIDYGILPSFLHSIQYHQSGIPFYLASLIGHYNPYNMQLIRRRYFGNDESSNPLDHQKSSESQIIKKEDINHHAILSGIKKISDKKELILETIDKAIAQIESLAIEGQENQGKLYNSEKKHTKYLKQFSRFRLAIEGQEIQGKLYISEKKHTKYLKQFSRFRLAIEKRIIWMEENFKNDLENIEKNKQEFLDLKWRMHPKFTELMAIESELFYKCARKSVQNNSQMIAKELDINAKYKKEILEHEVPILKKESLKKLVNSSFALHNAVMINDIKLTQWLLDNDIADINKERKCRRHNYQYFNLTPLGIAIAIYHDKLVYDTKNSEYYHEIIDILAKKFFEKNGKRYNENTQYEGSKYRQYEGRKSAVKVTFRAYKKYKKIREFLNKQK